MTLVVFLCLHCEQTAFISRQERKPVFRPGGQVQLQFNSSYQVWFGVKHTLDTVRLSGTLLLVGSDGEEVGMGWPTL